MAGKRISRQKLNIALKTLPIPVQEHCTRCRLITAYLVDRINTEDWFIDAKLNGESIVAAVYYHDIGKAALPTDALYSEGEDSAKNAVYLRHIDEGVALVNSICDTDITTFGERSFETYVLRAITEHHERYDGRGTPAGLRGDNISIVGRITALVDAVDNIFFVGATASRGFADCISELAGMAGKSLDAYLVNTLIDDRATLAGFIEYIDTKNKNKRKNDNYGLQFYFRPVQNIREGTTFAWESEYLINDPYYGILRPEIFLPVADTAAQMTKLSKLALERLCLMLDLIAERSDEHPRVSIRMAAKPLGNKTYADELCRLIDKYKIKKNTICLVFDETGLLDGDVNYVSKLAMLREGGYRVAIGIKGEGASLLASLDDLPADYLFVDHKITNRIPVSPNTYGLVSGMLDIAHNLHMSVVFEGMDTRRTEGELLKMQVKYAVGELYGEALSEKELVSFICGNGGAGR